MSKKDTLSKKPHQESKKGALSRNLNKSLERCFINNLHKMLYKEPHIKNLKKVPYQGR